MSLVRFPTDFDIDDIDHEGQGRGLVFWGGVQFPGSDLYVDSSLYGNDGTLTNMDPPSDWVEGPHGPALDFDGSNDGVILGDDVVGGLAAFSASVWIWPITVTGDRAIIGQWSATASEQEVLLRLDTQIEFFINTGTFSGGTFADAIPPASKWSHVVAQYDGAELSVYLNGSKSATTFAKTGTIQTGMGSTYIGRYISLASPTFHGRLSDPRIYNRALSNSEVWDLYQHPTGIILPRRRVYSISGAAPAAETKHLTLLGVG